MTQSKSTRMSKLARRLETLPASKQEPAKRRIKEDPERETPAMAEKRKKAVAKLKTLI